MNFIDIAFLTNASLAEGRLTYVRRKTKRTGKATSIALTPEINSILAFYLRTDARPSDCIFPIIHPKREMTQYRQAQIFLSSLNHALKQWAGQLGLPSSLSFNTARHSWATIGHRLDVPLAIISQGLGHTDLQTTQIYLDEFNQQRMDEASSMVSKALAKTILSDAT